MSAVWMVTNRPSRHSSLTIPEEITMTNTTLKMFRTITDTPTIRTRTLLNNINKTITLLHSIKDNGTMLVSEKMCTGDKWKKNVVTTVPSPDVTIPWY